MPTTGPNPIDISRILLLFFAVSLLLFVIIAFFALYFCRSMFIHRSNSAAPDLAPPAPQALDDNAVGLDPSLVASFPTFTYSWVKNLHAGKCGLECAVCLSEFQDDDVLRLLTACSHVFHTDCIDFWLISHTTCPYCRHELNTEEKKSPEGREAFEEMRVGEEEERLQQQQQQRRSVSSFKEEGEEGRAEDEGGEEWGLEEDVEIEFDCAFEHWKGRSIHAETAKEREGAELDGELHRFRRSVWPSR